MISLKNVYPYSVVVLALGLLEGCKSLDRLATVGDAPPLTHIQNPTAAHNYQPVSMPMPTPQAPVQRVNSLWQSGARGFFKDQRASRVGDILTVLVQIDDQANIENHTSTTRSTEHQAGIKNLLGYENKLKNFLPKGVDPASLVNTFSNPSHKGDGSVSRKENINLKLAANIVQVLPNGNLVIDGRQEFRVNYDVRELIVHGIVRPEDITSSNTISYEKISEARISYGGRGQLDNQQQPQWGHQVMEAVMPF